jgi:hypothetical protein
LGAASLASRDSWVVGNASWGAGQQTLAEHWDGVQWTAVAMPNFTGGGSLSGVAGSSACDVWAVGMVGVGSTNAPLIEHWDCNSWSVVPSAPVGPGFAALNAVAIGPQGDTWAVGYVANSQGTRSRPLVEHLLHNTWEQVSAPSVGRGASLQGVAVGPDGSLWAVGAYSDATTGVARTLIELYQHGQWTVIPGPNHGRGDNVLSAAAVSPMAGSSVRVAAAGAGSSVDHTTQGPLIETWNGSRWGLVPNHLLPSASGSSAPLYGVAMTPAGDILVVGAVSNGGTTDRTLIATVHAGTVARVASPNDGPLDNLLFGVSVAPDGTAVAAGLSAHFEDNTLIETSRTM